MKKRVVLAVTNDLSGDQRVHKVVMSLMKSGYETLLLGRKLDRSETLLRPYACKRFKLLFNKGPFFYINYNFRLFIYLLFAKADIFLANDLDTLPAMFLAGKLRRKAIVYDSHEYFTEVPELVDRPGIKRIWELIERLIFPRLTMVYTVNRSIADIYENKYGVPVRVVRNVPSETLTEPVPGILPDGFTSCPVIIYQGAVNIGRGLEEMIQAMVFMQDIHFLIVGGGDIESQMKGLTESLGLHDRVYFAGRVPFQQLSWYTRQASIGMSLEQDIGLNYHYALPNKLFDYMQAGIPVIASGLPEIRRIVENASIGIVVDRFDPEYLSQTVRSMLSNPELLQEWRKNAKKAAGDYTWEKEETELLKFFPILEG
jgi:glycosyltransferase involved in cell wall biosynthesis